MGDLDQQREARARTLKFKGGMVACVIGGVLTGFGFAFGATRTGDEATQAGILAGVGVGVVLFGAVIAWKTRPTDDAWRRESVMTKRERLQGDRTRQIWLLPLVSGMFLVQGTRGLNDIVTGAGSWPDYLSAFLPVLYAWASASVAMGWDRRSRKERRFMEDELTVVLRARAVGLAFIVLMAGVTIVLGLGVWRPTLAILALPFVLAAAGATAGIRFAWLDQEAGKDG